MNRVRVPRMVDELMQIAIFEIDEAAFIIAGLIIGAATQQLIYGIIFGFVSATVFGRFKQNKNRGFLMHYVYWYGFFICKGSFADIADKRWFIK